jgi:hypothetical protein
MRFEVYDYCSLDRPRGVAEFFPECTTPKISSESLEQRTRAMLASTSVQAEVRPTILSVENLEKELGEKLSDQRTMYLPVMSQVSHYKEQPLAPAGCPILDVLCQGWDSTVIVLRPKSPWNNPGKSCG